MTGDRGGLPKLADAMSRIDLDPSFWHGKTVLLTGHTGFKGAWLALWLSQLGARVYGFALEPEEPSLYRMARLDEVIESTIGDVRDPERLNDVVAVVRPQIVLHLAAQAFVRESYRRPVETIAINAVGTANLLEAVRGVERLEAVLVVTSDKCYRNDDRSDPFAEDAPLGGDDPYSASKACEEIVAEAYDASFFRPSGKRLATARAGNVIGGGDFSADRIVPDIVRALRQGGELRLRYPQATRPWQHVLEPLYGYLILTQAIANDASYGGAWNFGPKPADALSVAQLVDACFARWGALRRGWIRDEGPHPKEHHRLILNAEKAERRLGVRSFLSFEERCSWTIDWYKGWSDGSDPRDMCRRQIDAYATLATTS